MSMEKMKNVAIPRSLNIVNAFTPSASAILCDSLFPTGHLGSVKQKASIITPSTPDTMNWLYVCWNCIPLPSVIKFTKSILQMKPTVPNTLIGGKSLTVSNPFFARIWNATEFERAMVGI